MDGIDRKILELASEDYYGLWEIIWAVRSFPGYVGDPTLIARTRVEALLQNGRLHLYTEENGIMRRLEMDDALQVIICDDAWREPRDEASQVFRVGAEEV